MRTGRALTEEAEVARREKIRAATARQFSDPAAREHHSAVTRAYWLNPEYRAKLVAAHTGHKHTPEHKRKIAASSRGRIFSLVTRERIAEAARKRWATYSPKRRHEITSIGLAKSLTARPTSLETAVANVLDTLGIEYVWEQQFGQYFVDFYVPTRQLVIECDGEYWHRNEDKAYRRRRDNYLKAYGFKVVHIPEAEIRADAKGAVLCLVS